MNNLSRFLVVLFVAALIGPLGAYCGVPAARADIDPEPRSPGSDGARPEESVYSYIGSTIALRVIVQSEIEEAFLAPESTCDPAALSDIEANIEEIETTSLQWIRYARSGDMDQEEFGALSQFAGILRYSVEVRLMVGDALLSLGCDDAERQYRAALLMIGRVPAELWTDTDIVSRAENGLRHAKAAR